MNKEYETIYKYAKGEYLLGRISLGRLSEITEEYVAKKMGDAGMGRREVLREVKDLEREVSNTNARERIALQIHIDTLNGILMVTGGII